MLARQANTYRRESPLNSDARLHNTEELMSLVIGTNRLLKNASQEHDCPLKTEDIDCSIKPT